jgi:transcriptional regulator with XRE-family HTH domain
VARRRAKDEAPPPPPRGLDVNAVVSYNLRTIRQRQGWTQEAVAQRLAQLTGHELPQASISAMERGFDGNRRRRFDAHELYLLSVVFGVPIMYFFLPPPTEDRDERYLADTEQPVSALYAAVLGEEWHLTEVDARLTDIGLRNPEEANEATAAIYGADWAASNWAPHFRTWRKKRIALLARQYGDQLDEVAEFLAEFADRIKAAGPKAYLQWMAHRDGENPFIDSEPGDESSALKGESEEGGT